MSVYVVWLYWQHDLDLIALAKHPDFNIGLEMKGAVCAYARHQPYTIHVPEPQPYAAALDTCFVGFRLHPEKDADVIACLNGFRSGHCRCAIKNIFRQYMDTAYLAPYFNEEMFKVRSKAKRKNRDVERLPSDEMPMLINGKRNASAGITESENGVSAVKTVNEPKQTKLPNKATQKKTTPINRTRQKDNGYDTSKQKHEKPQTQQSNGFDLFGAVKEMDMV